MKKTTSFMVGIVILVNACIWGFAMIMSSRTLSGTGSYQQIEHILSGSAAVSLLVVGGGLILALGLKSETSKREN